MTWMSLVRLLLTISLINLLWFALPSTYAVAQVSTQTSPLLKKVKKLQCAKDQKTAEQVVETLRTLVLTEYGVPLDQLTVKGQLYAGSLDITLDTLIKTAKKYPKLRRLVERTLLTWNYCDVYNNGKFYDIDTEQAKNQQKIIADYTPPLAWAGFAQLGFLEKPATFVPELLSDSPLGDRAFEYFFHRIYRQQCFPHPTTGELFFREYRTDSAGLTDKNETTEYKKHQTYPYQWKKRCRVPVKKVVKKAASSQTNHQEKQTSTKQKAPDKAKQQVVEKVEVKEKPIKKPPAVKAELPPQKIPDTLIQNVEQQLVAQTPIAPKKPPKKSVKPKPKPKLTPKIVEKKEEIKPASTASKKPPVDNFLMNISLEELTQQLAENVPQPVQSPSNVNAAPVPPVINSGEKDYGFTGNIYAKVPPTGKKPSVGVTASWKPIKESYWFIRGNIDYSYTTAEPMSYSWGVGYDDWHQGTWSVQLNNWGPIKRGEGLAIDQAIGNIGYKFKSDTLEKYKLRANASVDIPVKGDPKLNLGMQWSFTERWYVRATVHQPFNDDETPTWSYGFGYFDWRAGKFSVEYSNYGANELFEDNFKENGNFSVTYNWSF
ncbi:MAG: hypothetical protein ACWA5U_11250 [bacterium]